MKLIVGLGNPGEEYAKTRHNAGRIVLEAIKDKLNLSGVKYLTPNTFMNNSGVEVARQIKNKKDLSGLVVIYDDIDIPFGKIKISFNRSSGGHNGLASVIRSLKSEEFVRIRVGIAPTTPTGKIKKPKGEDKVLKFLLGEFKKEELSAIKKISTKIAEAVLCIYTDGLNKAMSLYN